MSSQINSRNAAFAGYARLLVNRRSLWLLGITALIMFVCGCAQIPTAPYPDKAVHFSVHRLEKGNSPIAYLSFPPFDRNRTYRISPDALADLLKLELISGDVTVKLDRDVILNTNSRDYTFSTKPTDFLNITVYSSKPALLRATGQTGQNTVLSLLAGC